MKFVSEITLNLRSGAGGDGVIAWRRESKTPYGGPAGGNGGNGGSVYIIADINLNSLFHLRNKKLFQAENGESGKNKCRDGRNGKDLYIKVPVGVNIYNQEKTQKLGELIQDKEIFLAIKGGKGGYGNVHFKSASNPTPFIYERGDMAQEIELFLELEFISDIGFLGMPNAGKSTLLSSISNAKPKVADYPFTTLIPVLGAVVFESKKLIFSDIPGLIENASSGEGLGFEFLKHLNRCKTLVHLADISSDTLISDIACIRDELEKYSSSLYNKPYFICLNKIDLVSPEIVKKRVKDVGDKFGVEVLWISAKNLCNIDIFLKKSFDYAKKNLISSPPTNDYLEISDDPNLFASLEIERKDDFWEVKHPYLKYWTHKIPTTTQDNKGRLLKKIESLEVLKALQKRGAKEGDDVHIYDFSFSL